MTCYFFVDNDGTENVSNRPPLRHPSQKFWVVLKSNKTDINKLPYTKDTIDNETDYDSIVELPRNTIKTLFGKTLTWKDSPIKISYDE